MAIESPFIAAVNRFYATLILRADETLGLGGRLLYAAELDFSGRALVVAGNIAGAASLAATADPVAQKQAIREGVVNFLVTSLDEALRILKNEIRKRETVAVCVAASPQAVAAEMLERGVLPDLLPPDAAGQPDLAPFRNRGSQTLEPAALDPTEALLAWSVASAPALWMPRFDAIADECLGPKEWAARRWLRLAPRYLGRQSQAVRLLRCKPDAAQRILEQVRRRTERSEIAVPVEIRLLRNEAH